MRLLQAVVDAVALATSQGCTSIISGDDTVSFVDIRGVSFVQVWFTLCLGT